MHSVNHVNSFIFLIFLFTEYLGCFRDPASVPDPGMVAIDEELTPTLCENICSARGYTAFSLSQMQQCWCTFQKHIDYSLRLSPTDTQEICDLPCFGRNQDNEPCGSHRSQFSAVYHIDAPCN